MKTLSVLLLIASLTQSSAALYSNVFVRSVTDKLPDKDEAAISLARSSFLNTVAAITDGYNRALRMETGDERGLKSSKMNCARLCRTSLPGTCAIWLPQCVDYRRLAEADESGLVFRELGIATLAQKALANACEQAKDKVLQTMRQAASKKSLPIIESAELTCFGIFKDDSQGP